VTKDPRHMDRLEILKKVLEVNPSLRVGEQTPEQMTDDLLASIRASKQAPKFSDERFFAAFRGMLGEIEGLVDRDLTALARRREPLVAARKQALERVRERLVEFLAAAHPGAVPDAAKDVLRAYEKLLAAIGATISDLNRCVRERSSTLRT